MSFRKRAQHDTRLMQKHALVAEELIDFHEGDRVMTVDGYPGRVTAVNFGPYQGTEDYEVVLDNGVGGGTYAVGQLHPLTDRAASRIEAAEITASIPFEAVTEHTADLDYPELGNILVERPPAERVRVFAAKNDSDDVPSTQPSSEQNLDQQSYGKDDPADKDEAQDEESDEDPENEALPSGPDVTPPSACSFCGATEFGDPQVTGRGTRMRCNACGGTMKSWGGQWEPEFPNSPQNNASEMGDYREGGAAGVNNVPWANFKASSLDTQAGIVNYFIDKVYDRILERQNPMIGKEWADHAAQILYQGPAHYDQCPSCAANRALIDPSLHGQSLHPGGLNIHGSLGKESDLNDDEWGWHFTASWMDVQAKARRIRSEGNVKILNASKLYVVGEVQGDHNVYETQLNYVPGSKKVADWGCGCKWASYSWGRSKAFARFEGRLCSHALALQYEANARGMFGKDVRSDSVLPPWQSPADEVVVQHERGNGNLTRHVIPQNLKRTFSASILDSDGIYANPSEMDLVNPPIFATAQQMVDNGEDILSILELFASFKLPKREAKDLSHKLILPNGANSEKVNDELMRDGDEHAKPDGDRYNHKPVDNDISNIDNAVQDARANSRDLSDHEGDQADHEHKKKHHLTNDGREHAPHWGWGLPWGVGIMNCPQCGGSGCGYCAGQGQVTDDQDADDGLTDASPGVTSDAGTMSVSSSQKTADYSSADPLVGVGDQNYYAPTPRSHSRNPASTGWATSQDPGDWGRSMITNNFGITFDASLHVATHPNGEEFPSVSGVALKAADTGRVLMIQRSNKQEKDPASGTWEFPGGHHEPDDHTSLHAGIREWQEEVGQPFPHGGHVSHVWRSGPYVGHVVVIPSEGMLDFSKGRSAQNPDDPDGDDHEQAAWWEIKHAKENPALRKELKSKGPWDEIKKAASSTTTCRDCGSTQVMWVKSKAGKNYLANTTGNRYNQTYKRGPHYLTCPARSTDGEWDGTMRGESHFASEKTADYAMPAAVGRCNTCGGAPRSAKDYIDPDTGRCARCDNAALAAAQVGGIHHDRDTTNLHHQPDILNYPLMHDKREMFSLNSRQSSLRKQAEVSQSPEEYFNGLRLADEGGRLVTAGQPAEDGHRVVGALQWFPNGEIWTAAVHPEHRREGIATALLDYARKNYPEDHIHHSGELSEDAREWSQKVASSSEDDELIEALATLHEEPEPALPQTDGASEDVASTPAGDTVDGPHVDADDAESIRLAFLASTGAKALTEDVPELLKKVGMKDFTHAEQQDLINENTGDRARNFGDLKIAGTHYEFLHDNDEEVLW